MTRPHLCVAIGLAVLVTTALPVAGQVPPPTAAAVVADAVAEARTTQRAVLIEFGASWCTWCRNFEAFVVSPDAGPVLARHFVVINLTVRERDDKTHLEHPGGNALMDSWDGADAGLPFYVFLDRTGSKVADSNAMPDGTNIGFPALPEEIDAFLDLMARAAPALSSAERDILDNYLTRVNATR